jgi:Carboxypeptidase regulatory-like domain
VRHTSVILGRFQVVILIAAVSAVCPFSNAQKFHGSLRGFVQDATLARVPFARIALRAAESSVEVHAETNGEGEFRVDSLAPGTYHLVVNAKGFAQALSDAGHLPDFANSL